MKTGANSPSASIRLMELCRLFDRTKGLICVCRSCGWPFELTHNDKPLSRWQADLDLYPQIPPDQIGPNDLRKYEIRPMKCGIQCPRCFNNHNIL